MKEKYYRVAKSICRWKFDNPFENWLGNMADRSEFWKRIYVLYYKLFDSDYYTKGLTYLRKEIERQRPNAQIVEWGGVERDMIYSLHRFGASFEEYFVFQFYNLNAEGRLKFNTLKMQYGYCEQVNGENVREKFEDKGKCFDLFRRYYKRDVFTYMTEEDREQLGQFVEKYPKFICKPLSGHSGQGIKIYDLREGNSLESIINSIKGGFVIEELIEQAAPMSDLHPESINTLRIFTFKIKQEVEILGAAIRMGTGNSFVDNAGAGGIYVGVDVNEGIVNTIARDNLGNKYLKHPDTDIVFPGFKVPDWKEAKELIKDMALVIPNATMISWDLAYSTKGWCMVEGNDVGEAYLYQAQTQTGAKEKIIRKIDQYYKERK